jgi:arabinofuranosyltransferase
MIDLLRRRWFAACITFNLCLQSMFLLRTAFRVDGQLYFSLFDDAMIAMQYAKTLAATGQLTWYPDTPPVEGVTNLLWVLVMTLVHLLPISIALTSLVVSMVGGATVVSTIFVTRAIARRISTDEFVHAISVWLVGLSFPLMFWGLRGMEVGLLTLLMGGAIAVALRYLETQRNRDLVWLSLLMVGSLLTRTDALVPCVLIGGVVAWLGPPARRKVTLASVGGALIMTMIALTLFRLAYFGVPLPATFYLKIAGYPVGDRIFRGGLALIQQVAVGLFVPLGFAAVALRRTADRRLWMLAAVVMGQAAYLVWIGGDTWEYTEFTDRFLSICLPGLFVLAAMGAVTITRIPAAKGLLVLAIALAVNAIMVTLIVSTPFASLRLWVRDPQLEFLHSVRPFILILLSISLGIFGARIRQRPHAAILSLIVLTTAICFSGQAWADWMVRNAPHVADDAAFVRYGLLINRTTNEDAVVGVVAAGAIPYFSERRAVDLLGKTDLHIARSIPQDEPFFPGHNKRDLEYSIDRWRPDLLAHVWPLGHQEAAALVKWGYQRIRGSVFVAPDSTKVDIRQLREGLRHCITSHVVRCPQ